MHHDDFKFEPVRGLPEALPKGEHILWQGSPAPLRLAKEAWKLNWVLGYFAVLAVWRTGASLAMGHPLTESMAHAVPLLLLGAIAALIVTGMAWVQAKATVYTLTNKRVALRIGAALTMTLNLPYTCIANANLARTKGGHGTIAFDLVKDGARISYLMTWPHVRPWRFNPAQPALRAIPDAAKVAAIFTEAAETRISEPRITQAPMSAGVALAAE
ncbi:photosynthetic complex putative assembly protein PuhB [Jannaschia pohangensis]|uniref:PH domain-containing protein n=1 Tax=Jannaschia pohangensis TaxID=390807 RepID=A0A1I3US79_9RHOB|nr:photosynthetic complex putative assembly protein PuhB [Jannaschia pohangensis]SFJ85599.1 PH domain-containing protein [Jannaschia pohangensis]